MRSIWLQVVYSKPWPGSQRIAVLSLMLMEQVLRDAPLISADFSGAFVMIFFIYI